MPDESLADLQQTADTIDNLDEFATSTLQQIEEKPAAEAAKDLTEARAAISLQLKQDKGLRKLIESKAISLNDILGTRSFLTKVPGRAWTESVATTAAHLRPSSNSTTSSNLHHLLIHLWFAWEAERDVIAPNQCRNADGRWETLHNSARDRVPIAVKLHRAGVHVDHCSNAV